MGNATTHGLMRISLRMRDRGEGRLGLDGSVLVPIRAVLECQSGDWEGCDPRVSAFVVSTSEVLVE